MARPVKIEERQSAIERQEEGRRERQRKSKYPKMKHSAGPR